MFEVALGMWRSASEQETTTPHPSQYIEFALSQIQVFSTQSVSNAVNVPSHMVLKCPKTGPYLRHLQLQNCILW